MVSLVGSKVLLAVTNFLLLVCGCTLLSGGMIILFDPGRVLLSRLLSQGPLTTLPHPLLYYLALGFAAAGLVLSGAGILGCWASCLYSFWMLTLYFLLIFAVLVSECIVYGFAWLWPQCLGLGIVQDELIKVMQRNYGTAGQEQFTAAIDLAQVFFNCCGIQSSVEYDTSLWRLQALGPRLAVPFTCCQLENYHDVYSYLDPKPINASLCQALEPDRQQGFRHTEGCGDHLEDWFKQQYIIFLAVGLIIVLIEFAVLLSVILACTKLYKYRHELKEQLKPPKNDAVTFDYETSSSKKLPKSYSNNSYTAYTMTDSFRHNYRLADKLA